MSFVTDVKREVAEAKFQDLFERNKKVVRDRVLMEYDKWFIVYESADINRMAQAIEGLGASVKIEGRTLYARIP